MGTIQTLKNQIGQLQAKLALNNKTMGEQQATIAKRDGTIADLNKKMHDLNNELAALRAKAAVASVQEAAPA